MPKKSGKNSHTILVVDDDNYIRLFLKETLEGKGFKVELAEDGAQALALVQDSPPDLVLTDLKMPHKDGLELLKIIRPRAVFLVKHEGKPVETEVLGSVLGYFVLYVISLAAGTLFLTLILQGQALPGGGGPQGTLTTAFTSCLATLSNIGPGLAGVGPSRNFSEIPDLGKWVLSLLMLMGRLEIFTVVALMAPNTWRK